MNSAPLLTSQYSNADALGRDDTPAATNANGTTTAPGVALLRGQQRTARYVQLASCAGILLLLVVFIILLVFVHSAAVLVVVIFCGLLLLALCANMARVQVSRHRIQQRRDGHDDGINIHPGSEVDERDVEGFIFNEHDGTFIPILSVLENRPASRRGGATSGGGGGSSNGNKNRNGGPPTLPGMPILNTALSNSQQQQVGQTKMEGLSAATGGDRDSDRVYGRASYTAEAATAATSGAVSKPTRRAPADGNEGLAPTSPPPAPPTTTKATTVQPAGGAGNIDSATPDDDQLDRWLQDVPGRRRDDVDASVNANTNDGEVRGRVARPHPQPYEANTTSPKPDETL